MFNLKSYSKFNLALKVIGQNQNGFHELFSPMCFIDLFDSIKIRENKSVFPSLFMEGKYGNFFDNFHTSSIENNTVMKALDIVHHYYKIPINFDISISKEIPVSGGLGGSATNAGTVIDFVSKYFNIDIAQHIQKQLVTEVGSDVPFFTQQNTALCEGIGDKINYIDIDPNSRPVLMLLLYPNFELNTKDIYKKYTGSIPSLSEISRWRDIVLAQNIDFRELILETSEIGNDLEKTASEARTEVAIMIEALSKLKGSFSSGMVGSGSSCYALFDNNEDLQSAVVEISEKFPSYEVISTRLLPLINLHSIGMSSRPAMEMIFHAGEEEGEWQKIR